MASLNNATTQNGYTPAASLACSPSRNITVQVNNAGVYYQLFASLDGPGVDATIARHGPHTAYYNKPGDSITGPNGIATEERFLQPGYWSFDNTDFGEGWCVGIQFRSAVANIPAQVTAQSA